ncbi:transcriptional antiterminator, BglG family [Granulicatella balaenopterae]|uniref:Transcriptional antiterminator, BglG family n=1 Tax=Granulicatella balaenopterae TaxID=137733 RepID=A0A1H9NH19_9LACT|nr:BglG family transcription antiterminator [Granulicatella balaenopterae]SER34949.1 transcriptional antiterminator, BglG family [Granulicatella balaenopterae]
MVTKKEKMMIKLLVEHKDNFVTSSKLAKEMNLSDKTVRKYLNQLTDLLQEHGGVLESKPGHGYRFNIIDTEVFAKFWYQDVSAKNKCTDVTQLEETSDREHYILNKLFFENANLSLTDLYQQLFISKTTLMIVLTEIKKMLLPYDLKLEQLDNQLSIIGEEQDIRHFMMDYFFSDKLEEGLSAYVNGSFLEDEINIAELTIIVLDECREAKLTLSDFVIHNLVLHIALMVKRLKSGYQLQLFPVSATIKYSKEAEVAVRILERVQEVMKVSFPIEEANYIALHLAVKQSALLERVQGAIDEEQSDLEKMIKPAISYLDSYMGTDFVHDKVLIKGLIAHLTPLMYRLDNHIQLANPLLEDVKNNYLEIFTLTKEALAPIPLLKEYQISDDEWAYIALHIMAGFERFTNSQKIRCLVVCATGYGSALMLKNRLEREFAGNMKIVDVISYYQINEEKLKGIDVIISSISLSNLLFPTPVVHVSVFLNHEDIANIRAFIDKESYPAVGNEEMKGEPINEITKVFDQVFHQERFFVFKEETNRDEVLSQLIDSLDEDNPNFKNQFMEQISLRETYSTIVFGNHLAFPHPTMPLTFHEKIAVAICQKPLQWDKDHQEVRFVILMSPSKDRNENIKVISPMLVEFVEKINKQQEILAEPSFKEFRKVFLA